MTSFFSTVTVTFPPKLERTSIAREALNSLANANSVPSTDTSRLQIVLDELLSNVIMHGYGTDRKCDQLVELRMGMTGPLFQLELIDAGPPFNPTTQAFASDKDRPRIGGRGLDMVRALSDKFTYARKDNRNHTCVTKAVTLSNKGATNMIPGLQIKETRSVNAATVALAGRIDSGNAAQLTEHLNAVVAAGHKDLILDMAKLEYLTSAGFRTLLLVSDTAEEANGGLALANLSGELKELFDLSGLSQAFSVA